MLDYLPSSDTVIACKISGRLTGDELRDITQKTCRAIDDNQKTHMYCEIEGLSGIDWKAWAEQLPAGMSLLGKLDRFGRIAIVADQNWIRWSTRIESAVLPNISYEVFEPAERDRALAWVEGRIADPHESRLRLIDARDDNVIAFEMVGRASAEAMEQAVRQITDRMDAVDGPVRMLGRFRNFRMPEPKAVFDRDYLQMKLSAFRKVERYAVVGGPDWFRTYIATLSPLFRFDIRHFDEGAEGEAWAWIGSNPAEPAGAKATEHA